MGFGEKLGDTLDAFQATHRVITNDRSNCGCAIIPHLAESKLLDALSIQTIINS